MSSHDPLTIKQTYVEPPIFDLSKWDVFLGVMFAILSLCIILIRLIPYCQWHKKEKIKESMLKKTEEMIKKTEVMKIKNRRNDKRTEKMIMVLAANLPEETENLVTLILVDFCGYKSFDFNCQRYKQNVEKLQQLKQKFKKHQILGFIKLFIHGFIKLFTYKDLAALILISSLLFATYCGVVFLVQNDEHWKRYSIPFDCKVDANDTCIINSDEMAWYRIPDGYYSAIAKYKYSDYTNFYNDTFEPYLKRLGDAASLKHFEINPVLRISFQTQDVSDYPDRFNFQTNSYERFRKGYLYLSDNGLTASDVTLSQMGDDCCGDSCCDKACYRVKKGQSAGCECYCYREQSWDSEKEVLVHPGAGETCCECCCSSCGGLPCHCACVSCVQCCVGLSVFICILVIFFGTCFYFVYVFDHFVKPAGLYWSYFRVLESIIQEIRDVDMDSNDWMSLGV